MYIPDTPGALNLYPGALGLYPGAQSSKAPLTI